MVQKPYPGNLLTLAAQKCVLRHYKIIIEIEKIIVNLCIEFKKLCEKFFFLCVLIMMGYCVKVGRDQG